MFKVGDIVKGIDDFYSITNKKMTKGKVLKVDNDRIKIQILEHDVKKMLSEIEKCNIFDYLKDECFELLYDETVVSIGLREVNATIEQQKEAIEGLQNGLELLERRKKFLEKCKKTGNEMIELKSLKFPTWEEFEENLSSPELEKFRFAIQTDNKTDKIIMKCYDTMISWNVYDYSPEGYKLACEEIERIRKRFVLEICGG